MSKERISTIFQVLMIALLVYVWKGTQKIEIKSMFKVNECVTDSIKHETRKVLKVGPYIYNYCKMSDNICVKGYSMRIKDFDRIMIKTECK